MIIHIAISSHLLQFMPGLWPAADGRLEVTEGATVAVVLNLLNFPVDLEIITVVNDVYCSDRNRIIKDGDSLQVLPLIAGG